MKFKQLLIASILLVYYSSSYAIFGFGDLVFDPSVYGVGTQTLSTGIKQYTEAASQTQNQLRQIDQMYTQIDQLQNQLKVWQYTKIRNFSDVTKSLDNAANVGKSLHGIGSNGGSFLSEMAGDPSLAGQSYFDTLSGTLNLLKQQNEFMKKEALAGDDLVKRMNGDVKGGTSAIGALANLSEAFTNQLGDLNKRLEAQMINNTSKEIKEQVEKDRQRQMQDTFSTSFLNVPIHDSGKWDWNKFKPIYTSSNQQQVV